MKKDGFKVAQGRFTRRTLLKTSAIAATALSHPWLLNGCNSDSDDSATVELQPGNHHHFNLSHADDNEDFMLNIGTNNRYPLVRHDEESRSKHRALTPSLALVPDEMLTHYVEDVIHPDTVSLKWVTQTNYGRGTNSHGLALVGIHLPAATMSAARAGLRKKGLNNYSKVLSNFGITATDDSDADDLHNFTTPLDTAKALIFHHPELMSLDADTAAVVLAKIEQSNFFYAFALYISSKGVAHEHVDGEADGWAVLEPILNDDGTRLLDEDGNDVFSYNITDGTLNELELVVRDALQVVKDDPDLENIKWSVRDGEQPSNEGTAGLASDDYMTPSNTGQLKVGLDRESQFSLKTTIAAFNEDDRTITLQVENSAIRHLACCLQYLDIDGSPIPLENLELSEEYYYAAFPLKDNNTGTAQVAAIINAVSTVLGIPTYAENNKIKIELPAEASFVSIVYGGLGTGMLTDDEEKMAALGKSLTIIIDYSLPIFVLAAGAAVEALSLIYYRLKDYITAVMSAAWAVYTTIKIASGQDPYPALLLAASTIANILLTSGLQKLIEDVIFQGAFIGGIPFLGWGLKVLGTGSTMASMAQTTATVCSTPAIIRNKISLTHDIEVTIYPDADNWNFPETARRYKVQAIFSEKTSRVYEYAMPTTNVSEPIRVTLANVPVGGTVQITVGFYASTGWLAGDGSSQKIENQTPAGASALKTEITITQYKVPLSIDSVYNHKQKLTYNNNRLQWAAAEAPWETRDSLNCNYSGNSLCELNTVTVNQRTGMLGYVWRASRLGNLDCVSGRSGVLYSMQNISLKQNPEGALKTMPCGFSFRPFLLYDPADLVTSPTHNNFYIDPRYGKYHLRKVILDNNTPFNLQTSASYGRFSSFFDAAVVHPGGYIFGINYANNKMERLAIPSEPYADDEAPFATLLGGKGHRRGLMQGPRAITVTADGTLLVLEDQNLRIQAFDITGNPIKYFGGQSSAVASLKAQTTRTRYLDIGVEADGYIYVLLYTNDGSRPDDYAMDIYEPDGSWLVRTTGVTAARMTVDLWRNVYTLNYETIYGPTNKPEPSVSIWVPPAPAVQSTSLLSILKRKLFA